MTKKNYKEISIEIENVRKNSSISELAENFINLEKKYPNNTLILQNISKAFLDIGENSKALDYLLKAKKEEPDNFSIYFNLGTLYKKFKKDDEAITNFKKSVSLNKKFITGFNMLADIYLNKGELKEATECYKKSVNLDASKKNIMAINRLALAIVSIFLKDKDLKKLREAKKYFEKTYELDKDNDIFYNQLINFYHLSGLKNKAVYHSKNRTGVFII